MINFFKTNFWQNCQLPRYLFFTLFVSRVYGWFSYVTWGKQKFFEVEEKIIASPVFIEFFPSKNTVIWRLFKLHKWVFLFLRVWRSKKKRFKNSTVTLNKRISSVSRVDQNINILLGIENIETNWTEAIYLKNESYSVLLKIFFIFSFKCQYRISILRTKALSTNRVKCKNAIYKEFVKYMTDWQGFSKFMTLFLLNK